MKTRTKKKGPPRTRALAYARAAMRELLIAHARHTYTARSALLALVAIYGPAELRAAAAGAYLGEGIELRDVAERFLRDLEGGFAGHADDFRADLARDLASW